MTRIIIDHDQIRTAGELAHTASRVAHEAQPYNQDTTMFKSLERLATRMADASLRCLEESMIGDPASKEPDPADQPKLDAPTEGTEPTGTLLTPTDNAPAE